MKLKPAKNYSNKKLNQYDVNYFFILDEFKFYINK